MSDDEKLKLELGQSAQIIKGAGFSQNGMKDLPELPGDKLISADGGSSLLLGKEGLTVIQAGSNAKIILGKLMDFIHMYCREFKICSDFGEIGATNGSSGRQGFYITGGASYGDESSPSGGTYTSKIYVGDVPDNEDARIGIMVGDADGATQGGLAFNNDGEVNLFTNSDMNTNITGDNRVRVDGEERHQVVGNLLEQCNAKENTILGNEDMVVCGEKTESIGGDYNLQVGGTLTIGASGIVFTSMGSSDGDTFEMKCSSFNLVKS